MGRCGSVLLPALLYLAGACSALEPGSAWAAMDAKQVQIVAKVFSFLEKKPAAGAGIVITPNSADLAAAKSVLAADKIIEGPAANAGGAFAIFVTSAADAKTASGVNAGILTISDDLGCVEAGACILAIKTQPKVAIYVSRAAASKAGIEFDTSFKMLLTEK